jgi:hypothetical protein
MFQQHVWTTLSVWLAMGFLSKTQIWEDRCRTMWIPVQTRSSIRQVVHSKFRRPDVCHHVLDAQATYMEIACIRSTVWMTIPLVRTRSLNMEITCSWSSTVRTRLKLRKNFSKILESRLHSCLLGRLMSTVRTTPRFIKPEANLNLQPINRGP